MISDAELIGWSLLGDRDGFTEVVRRHEAVVGAYLARRAGHAAAEDLLAEVWLAAFRSRSSYDRSFPSARAWLIGIAHNILRRHWRSLPREDPLSETDPGVGWDPWPSIDERVDTDRAVAGALRNLRLGEREVLTMVVWEDLSVADAARALGIPPGTAYRYLHQARQALRSAPGVLELLTEPDTVKHRK